MEGRTFLGMDVRIRLYGLCRDAGSELCRFALSTVTIPGCEPNGFTVSDENGEVPVTQEPLSSYPYEYRIYRTGRALSGEVEISYSVLPRPFGDMDRCGPYFDLRAEDGGANFAGLSVLPTFEGFEGEIAFEWDRSNTPEGVYGVSTFGEGDFTRNGLFEDLRQSYYAAGFINSITDGDFGFYWLAEPNFDVRSIADYTKKLYAVMSPFFRDTDTNYRIFFRKDPSNYPSSGGTALLRSYMCGWNENSPVSVAEKQNILAHEMVHNWPSLNDIPYGTTSWYSEGTAEYYSIILPLRAGLIDLETALGEIQKRTDAYYTNPTRGLDNMEAARQSWTDRRTQRIPYGRGIFFLANCDVKIKAATNGERGIDDVVLGILERGRSGETLGNHVFLDEAKKVSGIDFTADHALMSSGGHFAPLPGSFGGHFDIEEIGTVEADTGEPCISYKWTIKD